MTAKKLMSVLVVVILLLWIVPLLSAIAAGGISAALGCQLNEGSIHPCLVFGSDVGHTLYTMFVLGWLTLIGIPYVAMALVIWGIIAFILSRHRAS
ncbi:MAG: hypothetical protein JO205_07460 [Pseudolabrys sp.]|nr:hypothetical protein [Pseudolabrys sp.]MBV9261192.1 hypothetical protein [Pseudolabrys sp.]